MASTISAVRPSFEDHGLGGLDGTALGFDLSFTRQYKWLLMGQTSKVADTFHVNQCAFEVQNNPATCFQSNKIPNVPLSSPVAMRLTVPSRFRSFATSA